MPIDYAVQRLAAFDEFMHEYRKGYWFIYADPSVPPELKHKFDEAIREVFYRGFAAGQAANLLDAFVARKTP